MKKSKSLSYQLAIGSLIVITACGVHSQEGGSKNQRENSSPVLVKRTGAIHSPDEVKECVLTDHDLKNVREVLSQLRELSNVSLEACGLHIQRQAPSIEYLGYLDGQQILFYQDSSALRCRRSPIADKLMDLIEKKCSDK